MGPSWHRRTQSPMPLNRLRHRIDSFNTSSYLKYEHQAELASCRLMLRLCSSVECISARLRDAFGTIKKV
jgi:hypothetical protein